MLSRVLWFCWFQGLEAAPELVRFAASRWKALNPDYEFRLLSQTDAERELAGWPCGVASMPPAAISDCLRLQLLATRGGVWVDATTLPTLPLADWLEPVMQRQSFFAFERPGPDRLLSSWFLASHGAGDPFVTTWLQHAQAYWYKPRAFDGAIPPEPPAAVDLNRLGHADVAPYFWLHYLFAAMLEELPDLSARWEDLSKLPADAAHRLQGRYGVIPPPTRDEVRHILQASPVHKLNWRHPYPLDELETSMADWGSDPFWLPRARAIASTSDHAARALARAYDILYGDPDSVLDVTLLEEETAETQKAPAPPPGD